MGNVGITFWKGRRRYLGQLSARPVDCFSNPGAYVTTWLWTFHWPNHWRVTPSTLHLKRKPWGALKIYCFRPIVIFHIRMYSIKGGLQPVWKWLNLPNSYKIKPNYLQLKSAASVHIHTKTKRLWQNTIVCDLFKFLKAGTTVKVFLTVKCFIRFPTRLSVLLLWRFSLLPEVI